MQCVIKQLHNVQATTIFIANLITIQSIRYILCSVYNNVLNIT